MTTGNCVPHTQLPETRAAASPPRGVKHVTHRERTRTRKSNAPRSAGSERLGPRRPRRPQTGHRAAVAMGRRPGTGKGQTTAEVTDETAPQTSKLQRLLWAKISKKWNGGWKTNSTSASCPRGGTRGANAVHALGLLGARVGRCGAAVPPGQLPSPAAAPPTPTGPASSRHRAGPDGSSLTTVGRRRAEDAEPPRNHHGRCRPFPARRL